VTAYPYLSEFEAALAQVVLAFGLLLALSAVIDRDRTLHRAVLLGIAALLTLRYLWWRWTATLAPLGWTWDAAASWSLFLLEGLALLGSLSSLLIMSRTRSRSAEADAGMGWWGRRVSRVAVLIPTYNEELEVLERTIVGAKALVWSNLDVLVLDDGRRDWLREFCAAQGVGYLRRKDNSHAKAGNVNAALRWLADDEDPPDFIAVLDADFVPHADFLIRTVALFADPKIGLVQTPQHFFNPDPIQHNLGLSRSYPDEQRLFFDHLQPARDAWGIAFCCGTSSIARWTALEEVGFLPTESVTEDFMLTLTLRAAGWDTAYLAEPLTEGLAPEGLKEYVTQRARWCLGMMQIARSRVGPFSQSALRLRDRWSVIDAGLYWLTTFPFRIAALIYPLLYWYFEITAVNASVPEVVAYFGTYFVWTVAALNILTRGTVVPLVNDISQLLGAIPITRAAFVGLLRPHGHPFRVTAKGGDRTQVVVQWRLALPAIVLLLLTGVGLVLGIVTDRFAYFGAGDGKAVVLVWTLYNLIVLMGTVLVCIELPRFETHIADRPELCQMAFPSATGRAWLTDLVQDRARLVGHQLPQGETGRLQIDGVGEVAATALSWDGHASILHLAPDDGQFEAMLHRFYAEGSAPGTGQVRFRGLLSDLARRLS
jgi:cellulose synthase (UDP-forming)